MMLEWSVEQATEVTTTAIDLEFLTTVTNVERAVRSSKTGVCVAADAYSTHGFHKL